MKKPQITAQFLLILFMFLGLACRLNAPLESVERTPADPSSTVPYWTPTFPTALKRLTDTIAPTIASLRTPTVFTRTSLTPSRVSATETPTPPVRYDVTETIRITNQGPQKITKLLLYVVLLNSHPPFQKVLATNLSPKEQSIHKDEDNNLVATFEFKDLPAGSLTTVSLRYQVEINPLLYVLGDCQGNEPALPLTRAEKYLEVDSKEIRDLSASLVMGKTTACEKARVIYDFVGDTLTYAGYNPQDIGALKALSVKQGDCTEFADLFIALSRAAGLSARYIDGVTCCTVGNFNPGDTKHNWAEIYLPGTGWVAVDPTWGRFPLTRERYFARQPAGHIVVGYGRNNATLDGYHFYYFRFWRDDDVTRATAQEEWSILSTKP